MSSSAPSSEAENLTSNPQSLLPFPIDFPATFPNYFSHNDALSELDTEGFKQNVITPATANLSAVKSETARLRSTLASLEREEARLRSALDGYHMRISAFRRFPAEVLAEIFHWCSIPWRNMLSSTKRGLWLVGQVCSQWRQIVMSQPALWTFVFVDNSLGDEVVSTELMKRAISLSAELPLKLHLQLPERRNPFPPFADPQICPPWLRELMNVSHRWQDLHLSCSLAILDDLGAIHGRLDSLQRLKLRLKSDYVDNDIVTAAAHRQIDLDTHVFRAFEVAPLLCEAKLDQACCNIALPLGQLTGLKHKWFIADNSDFRHSSLTRLHSLAYCSNLVDLRLVTRIEYVAPPAAMPPAMMIQLDSLRTLYVSDYHILDSIDCRNLEVLRFAFRRINDVYGDPYFDGAAALTSVLGLLARCGCDIKVFAIPEIQADDVESFLDVLRLIPSLDTLELDYFRWCVLDAVYKSFDEALQKIISELDCDKDDRLIPRLRSLSITISNLSDGDHGCSAHFIEDEFYDLVSKVDTERGTIEVGGRELDHVKIDIGIPIKLDYFALLAMRWSRIRGFDFSIEM